MTNSNSLPYERWKSCMYQVLFAQSQLPMQMLDCDIIGVHNFRNNFMFYNLICNEEFEEYYFHLLTDVH